MGHGSNKTTIPVNSDDVVATTSYNNHDWGHFCSSSNTNINKWSLWKPYRCAGEASPSNLQVAQMHFGIDVSTARHTGLENAVRSASNSQPAPGRVAEAVSSYAYLPPTGGAASPYRITDYADTDDPNAAAQGIYFRREYDQGACAPDEWHDWRMTEALLKSLSEKTYPNTDVGGVTWTLPDNDKGIRYQDCNLKLGPQTQEVIGYRPSNAMPLSYIFGDGRIASENWRMGVAIYLPKGVDTDNNPRWMLFAGNGTLTSSNGRNALPFTGSSIELCKALYYNFKTHNINEFTFIPCIVLNCTPGYTAAGSASAYTTRVELLASLNAQLLLPPTFTKCKLYIDATPVPGQVEQYADSSYRGCYSTNLIAGTYKIIKTHATASGSGYNVVQKLYRVTIPSGTTVKIEHVASGYGSTGNLKLTASGNNLTVHEYADFSSYNSNTVSGSGQSVAPSSALDYFSAYIGASAPNNVSITLQVTKI